MSGSLLQQQEFEADSIYGFPAGTMASLGMSESSNGLNTGSLGNIFQVTSSTANNPGYGVSSVDGNDPYSVAAYLNGLVTANNGNLGAALYQYQGAGQNGNPTTPNSGLTSFLSSNGLTYAPNGSGSGSVATPQQSAADATASDNSWWQGVVNFFEGGLGNQTAIPEGSGSGLTAPLSGTGIVDNAGNAAAGVVGKLVTSVIGSYALRVAIGVAVLIVLAIALVALALHNGSVKQAVSTVTKVAA